MTLDRTLLNRLMVAEYPGRGARPAPVREAFHRFAHKEFLDSDAAERFHERTQFSTTAPGVDDRSAAAFRENETLQFAQRRASADYRGLETVSLPPPADSLGVDVTEAMTRRPGWRSSGGSLSRQQISTLLHYAWGTPARSDACKARPESEKAHPEDGVERPGADGERAPSEVDPPRRAYASCSGTYPIEPYLAVVDGDGLAPGLYAYDADDHALGLVRRGDDEFVATVADSFVDDRVDVRDAAVCPVLTGVFWRAKAKYGLRGYRLALHEAGHAMGNLQTVAAAMGLPSVPCASVREKRLEALLGVNGVDESVAYAGVVGAPGGDR